ncbi:MAG: hypothetical protein ACRCW1_00610 [Anaerotignaceae bacterium]
MDKIFIIQDYEVEIFNNTYPVKLKKELETTNIVAVSFIGTRHYNDMSDIEVIKDIIKRMKKILK